LPTSFANNKIALDTWFNIWEAVITRPMFEKESPALDEEKIISDPWWNLKITVAETLSTYFIK